MEFPVKRALNAEREIAAANLPLVRHVRIEHVTSALPLEQIATSGWKPATPANVGEFTAVGYFFAREIHTRVGVPIGLIHSSWGGTPIEAWMSPMAMEADPAFHRIGERWQEAVATYDSAKAAYDARLAAWNAGSAAAKARGEKAFAQWLRQNPPPAAPHGAPGDPWAPTGLFNGMINPLVPCTLCGILWYQGESNASRAADYHAEFAAMISAWRAHFGQGDVPFFWVNLACWRPNDPTDTAWAFLREAQTKTLTLPGTGQALAIDIGDPADIHPRNKQEVGRRLALLAKRRVYGFTTDDTGPTFVHAEREGTAMRVHFTQVASGLVAHNKPPQALELAGADRVFHPATGKIEGDTLLVRAPQVREPVAVRYAWRNCPDANLYGGSGLPAVPFRSDDW
jgi:sialate O-acetylesterase